MNKEECTDESHDRVAICKTCGKPVHVDIEEIETPWQRIKRKLKGY